MMDTHTRPVRAPIRRQRAEIYLLITLLSFAGSVTLTRLFLHLTGYPQIGGGELHIAHVLWGGLFLFIASLLPLILANNWVFPLTALLSGLGVGLFIDEVGKFITRTNDYFYPSAAPIIYVFFLLTVLLYVRLKRTRRESVRADLYYTLEDLQEVLDHDLSDRERRDIIAHLERVKKTTASADIVQLAQQIEDFIYSQSLQIVQEQPTWWERRIEWIEAFETQWLTRPRARAILAGALAAMATWTLTYPIVIIATTSAPGQFQNLLNDLVADRLLRSASGLNWFEARIALGMSVGLILLVAAVFIALGRDRRGIEISYLGLLFSLTIVNILIFYFDQFSTISSSIVQFGILLFSMRYRARFLRSSNG